MTTALDRLTTAYYNSGLYDAGSNPGGMGNGGHRLNLPLLLADVGEVAAVTNAAVLNAATVNTQAGQVALDRIAVAAAAGPVIAGMAAFGLPGRVQIANLNTLASSGFFYSTAAATGRPGGETDGFVFALSDAAADNASQLFHSKTNGKLYKRYRTATVWQAWEELTTAAAGNDTAFGAETTRASAATCDIGAAGSRLVEVTGTTTVTALGSTAVTTNPNYLVRFAGALTLTHHATALILPGGKSILTTALDHALLQYLGGGNWRCLAYFKASGEALFAVGYGVSTTIASAATVDLGTATALNVLISGTTPITSFGSSATTARPIYRTRFSNVLTLTHNAVSLILPGGLNIVTASGDAAVWEYLGGGNWKLLSYARADGKVLPAALADVATAKAGTSTSLAVTPAGLAGAVQTGVMSYGADSSGVADVLVLDLVPAVASLTEGMVVYCKLNGTNAGAATLNLNGLGAVTIKRGGASLRGGELRDGHIYQFSYDGAFWQLVSPETAQLRTTSRFTVNLGAIASGSNAQFTVGYTAAGRFSVTRTGSAASDWGIEVFPGIASGALISVAEKTWSSSVITFEVRQNSNALIDPSSLTITMWETL